MGIMGRRTSRISHVVSDARLLPLAVSESIVAGCVDRDYGHLFIDHGGIRGRRHLSGSDVIFGRTARNNRFIAGTGYFTSRYRQNALTFGRVSAGQSIVGGIGSEVGRT